MAWRKRSVRHKKPIIWGCLTDRAGKLAWRVKALTQWWAFCLSTIWYLLIGSKRFFMYFRNLVNKQYSRNWLVAARIYYSVGKFDLENVGVSLFQFDMQGQPSEQIKNIDSDIMFWIYAGTILPWSATIYHIGSHSTEYRKKYQRLFSFYETLSFDQAWKEQLNILKNYINIKELQNKPYVDYIVNRNTRATTATSYNVPVSHDYDLYFILALVNYLVSIYPKGGEILRKVFKEMVYLFEERNTRSLDDAMRIVKLVIEDIEPNLLNL